MKNLFILIALSLTLVACSSGGGGGAGTPPADRVTVTNFETKTVGTWVSECQHNQNGNYRETLTINKGGTGSTLFNVYQNQDCSGQVQQTQGPVNFTYQVLTATTVKSTFEGQEAVELKIEVQGNSMSVTSPVGTVQYTKIAGGGIPPGQTAPGVQIPNDFDSAAKGNWVTEECYQYQNGTTVRIVITIKGQGKASMVYNVYPSGNCSGQPQMQNNQNFDYTVDRFANGGGQITVNGEPSDVTFANNKMTLNSANGSTVYVKIN